MCAELQLHQQNHLSSQNVFQHYKQLILINGMSTESFPLTSVALYEVNLLMHFLHLLTDIIK